MCRRRNISFIFRIRYCLPLTFSLHQTVSSFRLKLHCARTLCQHVVTSCSLCILFPSISLTSVLRAISNWHFLFAQKSKRTRLSCSPESKFFNYFDLPADQKQGEKGDTKDTKRPWNGGRGSTERENGRLI